MLADIIDNTETPDDYPFEEDFKRDWLLAVADVAKAIAREI